MYRHLLCAAMLAALPGCSTGFNRDRMQAELKGGYQTEVVKQRGAVTADDITKARELKGQLRFPFKLAVDLQPVRGPGRWAVKEKAMIEEWQQVLEKRGVVSQVFVMSDMVERNSALPEIRLAAAKHGADAVLVIRAVCEEDRYANMLAVLYLSIVGAYFVPGSHSDTLCMLQGAVWDVGNEYLYASVESEGEGSRWGPIALLDTDAALAEARQRALADFGKEAVERLTALK